MSSRPIADHAVLSDGHGSALVDRTGDVVWLCWPRFDSPTLFGRLLDDAAGSWRLGPPGTPEDGDYEVERRYLDGTLVLATTFRTATGTVTVTDALATGRTRDAHALFAAAPRLLVRSATCEAGRVELEVGVRPRPEYGLVEPLATAVEGGVAFTAGLQRLVLSTTARLDVAGGAATGRVVLRAGESLLMGLSHSTAEEPPAAACSPRRLRRELRTSVAAWRAWSALHQTYDGPWREQVHLAGRVLLGLTHEPGGAVVAAATTSLPEVVGGERNWDYRYTWIRDAGLTLEALWVAACPREAGRYLQLLASAGAPAMAAGQPLQVVFGVGGERDLTERELPHLSGWRGSRPVRAGNDAWRQEQIDVHGELLLAAHRLREQLAGPLAAPDGQLRTFLAACADAAADRWEQPDAGIWELRGPPRRHVHSAVLCWAGLDRALAMADALGASGAQRRRWRQERDRVARAVVDLGWSEAAGAFTQAFGSGALDASVLLLPIVGLLPGDDARVQSTIDAVAAHLTDRHGLVRRYRTDAAAAGGGAAGHDGLDGEEGSFLICTFWLAQALARGGRVAEAREVFERAAGRANDVGLLAEQVDPVTGELIGNLPQAFSHVGLVAAAWDIHQAELAAAGAGTA